MRRAQFPAELQADETRLTQLWLVLLKQKIWIVSALILALVAALGYLLFVPAAYEARVKVRIGQVAEVGLFEAPELLASRLLAAHGEIVADGVEREPPFLKQASVPRFIPSTVEVVAVGGSPEEAAGFLGRVVSEVQVTHDKILQENRRLISERLRALEDQRKALRKDYVSASELIERLRTDNSIQASLLMLERGSISAAINNLDAEKPSLEQKLTSPRTQPTALLGEIMAPQDAASPKRALVLMVALVSGLVVGAAVALLAEFLSRTRAGALDRLGRGG